MGEGEGQGGGEKMRTDISLSAVRFAVNLAGRGEKWNSLAGQVSQMHYWRLVTLRCTHEELMLV